jgi:hypothetical protein
MDYLLPRLGAKEANNRAVARLFYANAIPFNVADSRYFKEAIKAVAACGPTYVPPGKVLFILPWLSLEIFPGDSKNCQFRNLILVNLQ